MAKTRAQLPHLYYPPNMQQTRINNAQNFGGGATDPLAGLSFAFRGYGLPTGAWQDTAETTAATADGDPVKSWQDNAGVTFEQGTSARWPTLNIVSGSTSLLFDGSDDRLIKASDITLSGDFCVFVLQATTGDCALVSHETLNRQILRIGNSGLNRLDFFTGLSAYPSDTLTTARGVKNVVGINRSGSTVTFYEGTATRGSWTNSDSVVVNCIGMLLGSSIPTTGDIYAVLIATESHSANITQIVDALNLL